MKDALPESPEPAQPLRWLTKRQGKRGEGKEELHPDAEPEHSPLARVSQFPSLPGAVALLGPRLDSGISVSSVLFQACLPSSTALDLGLLGEKDAHLSRWDPPSRPLPT